MAGTREGAQKARNTNLERDPDFYRRIGRKGGKAGVTGGFASEIIGKDGLTGPERARKWGAIGGKLGKRGSAKK